MSKFTPAQVAVAQMLGALMPTCASDEEFFGHLDSIFDLCNTPAPQRDKIIAMVEAFAEMSYDDMDKIDEMSGIAWLIEQAVKE